VADVAVLQNTYCRWTFTVQGSELYASLTSHDLVPPVPVDDIILCRVEESSATLDTDASEPDSLVVRWDNTYLTLHLSGGSLGWQLDRASNARVTFPGWASLFSQSTDGLTIHTEDRLLDTEGGSIFRHRSGPLPACCIGADGTTLTLLPDLPTTLTDVLAPSTAADTVGVMRGTFALHSGGWRAAFALLRAKLRAQVDLSEYQREDLAWYQQQWVQHFTFMYGREILNLRSKTFEIERFLSEAKRDFGGYDGILLWSGYPRLGVDERTQWELWDDLPGGRAELRRITEVAHQQGVRVFLPYKPWDRSAELHGRDSGSDAAALAQLIADIDADGVFLDTMSAIGSQFRSQIDAVRAGVVLCSELRVQPEAFEVITGSWDQSYTRDWAQGNWTGDFEHMPGVDYGRFIFPEHRLFVINRHAVGDDRVRVIKRGFFGGTGWVVWQDIFGLVLTYSPEEAALLKKCRQIFEMHEGALNSPSPTPLLPTRVPGTYCNEFPGTHKRLWTFYNDTDQVVDAPTIQVDARDDVHYIDLWNNAELDVRDGALRPRLEPYSVGAIVELPRLLLVDPESQALTLRHPIEGAEVRVRFGGSEWQGRIEGTQVSLPIPLIRGVTPFQVQLLRGRDVLDERIWSHES
jgi:hypothetical protein